MGEGAARRSGGRKGLFSYGGALFVVYYLLFINRNKDNEAEACVRMFSRFAALKGF